VEHCSTRGRELKRIINRCHGNYDHLKSFINGCPSCSACSSIHSSIDCSICYSIVCDTKSVDVPNTSCASLGHLYNRKLQVKDVKNSDFTEDFTLFVGKFINEVLLSEVAIIWLLYFVFAH
jgi:hypothetical protein